LFVLAADFFSSYSEQGLADGPHKASP